MNRITEMLGCKYPIIQAPMGWIARSKLASSVSNAGGLGIITGLTQASPKDLANEIARCKDMTDKPIGVNLTLPSRFLLNPDYPGYIESIVKRWCKKL